MWRNCVLGQAGWSLAGSIVGHLPRHRFGSNGEALSQLCCDAWGLWSGVLPVQCEKKLLPKEVINGSPDHNPRWVFSPFSPLTGCWHINPLSYSFYNSPHPRRSTSGKSHILLPESNPFSCTFCSSLFPVDPLRYRRKSVCVCVCVCVCWRCVSHIDCQPSVERRVVGQPLTDASTWLPQTPSQGSQGLSSSPKWAHILGKSFHSTHFGIGQLTNYLAHFENIPGCS
jgi:hypothetical protein